jgi:cell division ATPase FtsA
MGLGTVDFSVYCGGEIGHSAVLPVGGEFLVQDVSRYFRVPPMEVERLILEAGIASPEFIEETEGDEQVLEAPPVSGAGSSRKFLKPASRKSSSGCARRFGPRATSMAWRSPAWS